MSFVQKNWTNNPPSSDSPITAEELNRIESGIGSLYARGLFPADTHMDDAVGREFHGNWHTTVSSQPAGLPFDNVVESMVIEIINTDRNMSTVQKVTSSTESFWREASILTSGVLTWGDWNRYATGLGIDSVVYSPHEYIPDNSIAAVVDERHVAMDLGTNLSAFSTLALSTQTSWTQFAESDTFDHGGQIGHQPNDRAFALWDRHGSFEDGEILIRANIQSIGNNNQGGAVLRAGDGINYGYLAAINQIDSSQGPRLRIVQINPVGGPLSVAVGLASAPIQVANAQVYYIRFRVQGTTLMAKFWLEADEEPSGWTVVANDSRYSSGKAGLAKSSGSSASRWNYISINRSGGDA